MRTEDRRLQVRGQRRVRRVAGALRAAVLLGGLGTVCVAGAGWAAAMIPQPTHGVSGAPGYLGIDVRDVSEDQVAVLRLKDGRGAVVVRMDHDGPAGKMGLRERDVVVQMNGVLIEGEEQIRRMLHELGPGRTVTMVVSREGQQMTLTAQMADRAQVERQAWMDHLGGPGGPQAPATGLPTGDVAPGDGGSPQGPAVSGGRYGRSFLGNLLMSPSYTGAVLEKMGPQLAGFFGVQGGSGLLVRSIEPNSPAAMAGMRAGDVVVRANAHGVDSLGQWAKVIKEAKGGPVTVVVMRDRSEKTLTLMADGKRRSSVDGLQDGVREQRVLACLLEL